MTLEKELLAQNPINHKVGHMTQFLGQEAILDNYDASGNSAPLGYLFARKYNKPTHNLKSCGNDVFISTEIECSPVQEVLGLINIFTGESCQVPDTLTVGQIVSLYHFYFPKQTLWQRIKKWLVREK